MELSVRYRSLVNTEVWHRDTGGKKKKEKEKKRMKCIKVREDEHMALQKKKPQ